MPEDAVLDMPDTGLEDQDINTDNADDGSADNADAGESHTEGDQQQEHDEPAIIEADGKLKLSGKALETLNKLKADNPKQAREFRAALFDAAALRKEFPEGIREAIALKQELEEYGGVDGIGTMKGELDQWKGLDADWTGLKSNFAAEMAESNPEAFAFHAPLVMAKLAEVDPDRFSYEVSRVFASDMANSNVGLTMERMKDFILSEDGKTIRPGMEGIARQWNQLSAYFDRVNGIAKNAPKQKEPQQKTQGNDPDQREQQLTVREFQAERQAVKDSVTKSEFAKNLGNRKLSAEKISTIQELYETALNRAVQAVEGHKAKVDRYVAAKDRTGYRKYMDGIIRQKAPAAMAAAFRRAGVGDKPGPKAVPAKIATTTTATPANGFTRVGTKPDKNSIDWGATARARMGGRKEDEGKYVLRNGSKVLFQR